MAKNIDFMGAVFPDVPSVKLPQQGGGLVSFDDTTDATATASEILSGYTAYANGQKLTGTASGGITPSGTMSITSNGIYDIVSFASVDVNVSGGGGGDHDAEDGLIDDSISGAYTNSRVTYIGAYAFYGCSKLTAISFPNVISMSSSAFANCSKITTATFNNLQRFGNYAFRSCFSLMSVYLFGSTVPSCYSNTFGSTPIAISTYTGTFGSIYVPASLVSSYKASIGWSYWSARITSYVE